MVHGIALFLLCAAPAAATAARAAQVPEGGTSREQAALSEEQTLLMRKLGRLRTSMERLAERFDAEGRTHAATLLRKGLEHIAVRGDAAPTLEELMKSTEGELAGGQSLEAIRSQEEMIGRLERLLAILMDRPDLDELDRSLEEVRALKKELEGLADAEVELQKATEELRQQSMNEAQRSLESGIQAALEAQRELLAKNEDQARESGAQELEALEAELAQLLRDQQTDLGVLESWEPAAKSRLEGLVPGLESAREEEVRAARLAAAAEELRRAAEAAGAQDLSALEEAAQRAERDGRASGDESARQAAEALAKTLEALRKAGADAAAREQAAETAGAEASELEAAAAERRATAAEARAGARAELERIAAEPQMRGAAELARTVAGELDRSENPELAREATDGALRELRRGLDDQRFLGQALSASQTTNAERSESIQSALARRPQGATPEGRTADAALEEAEKEMRDASAAAAEERAEDARQAAQRAAAALERAGSALGAAREASAGTPETSPASPAEDLAKRQEELAREVEALQKKTEEGSLSEAARSAVEEALGQSASEMRGASQEMAEGRRGAAAGRQRQAIDALNRAAQEAREGVTPGDAEDRARAEELAREQAEIEKKLYDFLQRYRERKNATPLPSLDEAQASASRAQKSLQQGDLGEAQEAEQQTEEELRAAAKELQEEEEQYQRLRDEELLFQIAEEVKAMRETHQALMAETVEVDAGRQPDAPASRAEKLRLRKISRGEEALAQRANEVRKAIEEEQSLVFAELIAQIEGDLTRAARDMGEAGDYQSGDRVQELQSDVDRALGWLLEALEQEKDRREQEDQQQPPGGGDGQNGEQQGKNRLVPDVAELKLLRRMEVDVLDNLDELLALYPELEEQGAEIDPHLLEDILRMAHRHERTSDLFERFRSRLGLPDPGAEADTEPTQESEGTRPIEETKEPGSTDKVEEPRQGGSSQE